MMSQAERPSVRAPVLHFSFFVFTTRLFLAFDKDELWRKQAENALESAVSSFYDT